MSLIFDDAAVDLRSHQQTQFIDVFKWLHSSYVSNRQRWGKRAHDLLWNMKDKQNTYQAMIYIYDEQADLTEKEHSNMIKVMKEVQQQYYNMQDAKIFSLITPFEQEGLPDDVF